MHHFKHGSKGHSQHHADHRIYCKPHGNGQPAQPLLVWLWRTCSTRRNLHDTERQTHTAERPGPLRHTPAVCHAWVIREGGQLGNRAQIISSTSRFSPDKQTRPAVYHPTIIRAASEIAHLYYIVGGKQKVTKSNQTWQVWTHPEQQAPTSFQSCNEKHLQTCCTTREYLITCLYPSPIPFKTVTIQYSNV